LLLTGFWGPLHANPTGKLLKTTILSRTTAEGIQLFQVGETPFTLSPDVCAHTIAVHAALTHDLIREFPLPDSVTSTSRWLYSQVEGKPHFLFYGDRKNEPLIAIYPETAQASVVVQPPAPPRSRGRSFTHANVPYGLFMGPSSASSTPFYRVNLLNGEQQEFRLRGTSLNDTFEIFQQNGSTYGVMNQGQQAIVFNVMQDTPLVPDRRIHFPLGFRNGFSAARVTTYQSETVISVFDGTPWNEYSRLHIEFIRPFGSDRPEIIGSVQMREELRKELATFPNAPVRNPRLLTEESFIFEENKQLGVLFSIRWQEMNNHWKRLYTFNRARERLTEILPPPGRRNKPVLSDWDSVKSSLNSPVPFQGPDGKHYALLVTVQGEIYLIRLSDGEIVWQDLLPISAPERYQAPPQIHTRTEQGITHYYFTGVSDGWGWGRLYTGEIVF